MSHVQLFVTPWTATLQASLSFIISRSVLKFTFIESVMLYLTISSSVVPFSFCFQFFPASRSFPMSQFFASGGQSIGASISASVLPMNIQDWFPLGLTGMISLQSKGLKSLLQPPQFKSINSSALSFLYNWTLTSTHDYWKTHSIDWTDLCRQSNVSAFWYAVYGHNFSSKEEA